MKIGILVFSMILVFSSCKHDSLIEEKPLAKICESGEIDFVNQVLPILLTSCATAGCHNTETAEHGIVLDSYYSMINTVDIAAGNAEESQLFRVLNETGTKEMPPISSGILLNQTQKDLIKNWINQGAKNIECSNEIQTCDSVNVSFLNTVKPLIEKYCISCHYDGNATGVTLDSYNNVLTTVNNGSFFGSINHESPYEPMPQSTLKLGVCELTIIKNWIAEGALDN